MDPWAKSETVDPEVRAYVYSLVNAVGDRSALDSSYAIGDDALATLKDIRRWLLLYDEKTNRLDVKRVLAEANFVKGDLLEILAAWTDDAPETGLRSKLALACLELLVPLTWPLELDDERATLNTHRHVPYLQLAQVSYKRAILQHEDADILKRIVRIVLPSMAMARNERTNRDKGTIMLAMFLLKHVIMIDQPQYLPSQGDENDISRSAVIDAFRSQDVFTLLLTIGSGMADEYQDHDIELLEILYYLLQGISPSKLFMRREQVISSEIQEFKELLTKESALLSSYNKVAPTRHNRFGTMVWVKGDNQKLSTVTGQQTITNNGTILEQMDTSKKWNRPKPRTRVAQQAEQQAVLEGQVDLPEKTRARLRLFIEDFLDSSFNPLFSSLRKAIERELDRVKESNIKQYFFLMQWFLAANTARRNQNKSRDGEPTDSEFSYIAAVLDQETFVLLNRSMQRAIDEKDWRTLQATLSAFTQILLTVQSMSESSNEEDQDIAENILNRIFYEESTHDRIALALRTYKQQGFVYLDCVTQCVNVFIKLLEQYSKHNVDMHIRSKRRARKKAQKAKTTTTADDDNNDAEEAAEDEREAHRTVNERKFDFKKFVTKFQSQASVDTFTEFLQFYAEMNNDQLKRCHRFLYRLAFKNEKAILLFRVDTLALLQKLIRGPGGLARSSQMYGEFEMLTRQVFRKCIKWLSKETEGQGWREMCMVEMLFSKIPNTLFYLENGYEVVHEKRAPRPPAELDFKAVVNDDQRIAVAVSIVLDKVNGNELKWVKEQLEKAINERQAWQDADQAMAARASELAIDDAATIDVTAQSVSQAPMIMLSAGNEERKLALFKDKHLRLLLTTLGFERMGVAEDVDALWYVPSALTVVQLKESLEQVQRAEFAPVVFEDGKTALDMVRNKSSMVKRVYEDDIFSSDDNEAVQEDQEMFPPNAREKRKHNGNASKPKKRQRLSRRAPEDESLSDLERRAEQRRKKEHEKNAKIKSKLLVTESDDESDAEKDAEFFRLEEQRRQKTTGVINSALSAQSKKDKSTRRSKAIIEIESEEENDSTDEDEPKTSQPKTTRRPFFEVSDDSDDDQDAPSGSPDEDPPEHSSVTSLEPAKSSPLKQISVNARAATMLDVDMDDEEEEHQPIVKPQGRPSARRAGFVIDDDSD